VWAGGTADSESELNYWLSYASGPRTDQHPPSLRPEKEQEKLNLGEFNVKKKHPGEKEKTEEPLPKGNT
jgi:hypothetical protein